MLALASTRLARAVSTDSVTQPARDRLAVWAEGPERPGWRMWAMELVHCPLCVGWWMSLGVSLVAPGRHRVLRGIAVAGVQVIFSLAERLVSEEGRAFISVADEAEARSRRAAD